MIINRGAKIQPFHGSQYARCGRMPASGVVRQETYTWKKFVSSAWLIERSCWVSMEVFKKIFCTVRGWTLILSASHSLVCPCRRSSSLIICPMNICIKKTRAFCRARGSGLPTNQTRKLTIYRERSALMLIGARICPEFEPHVTSKIALIYIIYLVTSIFYIFRCVKILLQRYKLFLNWQKNSLNLFLAHCKYTKLFII